MIPARWIALPLVVLTGCAGITATSPRLLPSDLHIGALDQRTSFELDDRGSSEASHRSEGPNADAGVETPKQQRRRKLLYFTGLGAVGFGVLGTLSFGIGGRIVQAQMVNGYDDGTLTRDREDQLSTTGKVMNGLAIGSAVVGVLGVITAATMYGIDHARCGDLPPRRKHCPDELTPAKDPAPTNGSAAEPKAAEPEAAPAEPEAAPAEPEAGQ